MSLYFAFNFLTAFSTVSDSNKIHLERNPADFTPDFPQSSEVLCLEM